MTQKQKGMADKNSRDNRFRSREREREREREIVET